MASRNSPLLLRSNGPPSFHTHLLDTTQPDDTLVDSPASCRLPSEILQEIFSHIYERLDVFDLDATHYIVGQVCHKWRTASHSFPRMWSRFVICLGSAPYNAVARVQTVLQRARNIPLDLVASRWVLGPVECSEMFSAILALLMEHSSSWECANIEGLTMNDALYLSAIRGRVPILRSLRLQIEPHSYPRSELPHKEIVRAFEIAPCLAHLKLHNIPFGHVSLEATIYQQLKSFADVWSDDDGLDLSTFFARGSPTLLGALRQFPNLTSIDVRSYSAVKDWQRPPPHNIARDVYTSITSVHTIDPSSLNRILLPNLTVLGVGMLFDALNLPAFDSVIDKAINLIRHSRCSLSTLAIGNGALDFESLCELFELTPVLQSLRVSYCVDTDANDILQDVTRCLSVVNSSRYKYVPNMESLQLVAGMLEWTFVDGDFLDMISRRRGLREVDFTSVLRHEVPEGIESFPSLTLRQRVRLQKMVRDGVVTMYGLGWSSQWRELWAEREY